MSKNIVKAEYEGLAVTFGEDGWFNATEVAGNFGKRPADWLALDSTREYITTLTDVFNCEKISLLKTKRGRHHSGTWFHPKLAVPFARWLDLRFAVWCDYQIDQLLRGNHPHFDWKKMRSEAASSFKVMNEALQIVREHQGKATKAYHFMNESKLINGVLTGNYKGIDRDALPQAQLDLLARLEVRNSVLIGQGFDYQTRKASLLVFVAESLDEVEHLAVTSSTPIGIEAAP